MIALRENEPLATSVGVDVTRYLVLATMISAAMAGAAGALYAHYVRIVDPDVFLFIYTVTMVIMVVSRRQGHARRPHRRRPHLRPAAGDPARGRHQARGAVGDLRRADDPRRLFPARGHRAGRAALVAGPRHGGEAAGRRPAPGRGGRADERARRHPSSRSRRLTIRFGGLTAVDGVTFEVRAGRGAVPHRSQRRRQDHRLQRHHRLHRADRRRGSLSRRAPRRPQAQRRSRPSASCARSRRPACSPAQTAHDNVADRPASALAPAAARHPARPALGGARGDGAGDGGRRDPALRRAGGARARRQRPRRCPTASCGCSRSPSRSPRSPSCCCSTSPCPA